MGQITIVIPDDLENKVRDDCRIKGDMSRLVTKALQNYYKPMEVID